MKKADVLWNVLLYVCLMGFFLLMKVLGLHTVLSLRYFNLVIHFSIVYMAMKAFRARAHSDFSFLETALAGVRASVPAVIFFALSIFAYLRFIDTGFMDHIRDTAPMGEFMSPPLIVVALAAEGLVASFFNAYVGMRLIAAQEKVGFPSL